VDRFAENIFHYSGKEYVILFMPIHTVGTATPNPESTFNDFKMLTVIW